MKNAMSWANLIDVCEEHRQTFRLWRVIYQKAVTIICKIRQLAFVLVV